MVVYVCCVQCSCTLRDNTIAHCAIYYADTPSYCSLWCLWGNIAYVRVQSIWKRPHNNTGEWKNRVYTCTYSICFHVYRGIVVSNVRSMEWFGDVWVLRDNNNRQLPMSVALQTQQTEKLSIHDVSDGEMHHLWVCHFFMKTNDILLRTKWHVYAWSLRSELPPSGFGYSKHIGCDGNAQRKMKNWKINSEISCNRKCKLFHNFCWVLLFIRFFFLQKWN